MRRSTRETETDRGRDAQWPSQLPLKGWRDILWRIWREIGDDRVTLIAAGATFFLMLSIFPALAAFVSLYGLIADPAQIGEQIGSLVSLLPSGGVDLIQTQLESLVSQDRDALSFGFALSFVLAFWSTNSGIKSLFDALNVAYEEHEKRSFIALNLLAFAFTLGAMLLAVALIGFVVVAPAALAFLSLGALSETLLWIGRWPVAFVVSAFAISLVYRYGPSRSPAKWRWISWGSMLASMVWIAVSIGFSYYLENFADYNATYGSLGAFIGFMLWIWISVTILIVGAELNAEMEHQTSIDSTTGKPQPMGERGAVVADTLGTAANE